MTYKQARRAAVAAATVVATALTASTAGAATMTGPSTTTSPYVLPVASGVDIESLFTVADGTAGNGYRMVGIPDGLGAYRQGANLVVYENQELGATVGIVRAHGQKGAFVSRLVLDPASGRVKEGSDLIQSVRYWDYSAGVLADAPVAPDGAAPGTHSPAFGRFCSGSLAAPGQLFNADSRNGFAQPLWFANEESGVEGRAFAVDKAGTAWQLPRLGLFSWENAVPAPNATDTTLVVGQEDDASGQLRIYSGTKQRSGSPVAKAGLTNGALSVASVAGAASDAAYRTTYGKNNPQPFTLAGIDWTKSGAAQNAEAAGKGISLNRIEDGSFDPDHPDDYYFLTTEGGDATVVEPGVSRDGGGLWRLRFTDVEHPELGGTLTLLLDGGESPYLNKPDNLTVDAGNVVMQEDPGNNAHIARIVAYRIADGARGVVARFDPALFGGATPLTRDEESSGIIPLGDGSYLFDAQVHTASGLPAGTGPGTVQEYVERGQLLRMKVADWAAVYA